MTTEQEEKSNDVCIASFFGYVFKNVSTGKYYFQLDIDNDDLDDWMDSNTSTEEALKYETSNKENESATNVVFDTIDFKFIDKMLNLKINR